MARQPGFVIPDYSGSHLHNIAALFRAPFFSPGSLFGIMLWRFSPHQRFYLSVSDSGYALRNLRSTIYQNLILNIFLLCRYP